MIEFFNIIDNKELEGKLALTESNDVVQYICNLDSDEQDKFLQRLENIYGEIYITITKEAVKYFKQHGNAMVTNHKFEEKRQVQ